MEEKILILSKRNEGNSEEINKLNDDLSKLRKSHEESNEKNVDLFIFFWDELFCNYSFWFLIRKNELEFEKNGFEIKLKQREEELEENKKLLEKNMANHQDAVNLLKEKIVWKYFVVLF